ncbi:MAG TPA: YciI family protein [Anaerolineaceae bacterium]|nr:YciI family protein [Anaerolineaceae bacterium]HQH84528.1 YciI family protein [Anaerolineaceae bacterium]
MSVKHFMVEITYTVPAEALSEILPKHRAFLQTGYDQGVLLMSGPQEPRTGGIVIARAESMSALKDFFKNDPYQINQVATYRFVEFVPVKHQPWLGQWVNQE